MIRIKIKRLLAKIRNILFVLTIIIGMGIRSTISMSNTIKITARRKNRVENGMRAEFIGSNPHSKGEIFSRSLILRMHINEARRRIVNGIMIDKDVEIMNIFMN
jgi:hypothetical protein